MLYILFSTIMVQMTILSPAAPQKLKNGCVVRKQSNKEQKVKYFCDRVIPGVHTILQKWFFSVINTD
jgi:hypothetical protein